MPGPSGFEARLLDVVHLGRAGAWGNRNRLETWQALGAAAGADVQTVDLAAVRCHLSDVRRAPRLLGGVIVPEALSWSGAALTRRLRAGATTVFITARSFDPVLVPPGGTVVLDLVDRLSESYRLRSALSSRLLPRLLYDGLQGPMRRFEARERPDTRLVAAGRADAADLDAGWVPNLLPSPPQTRPDGARGTDLLFHGSLGYPPNVEAVHQLRALWPALQALRPGTTATIAGAAPSDALARLVQGTPGWTLQRDFPDLSSLLAGARVAVAPLLSATGLQNKVLEAASAGLPVVVTPAVARGFDPAFPALVAPPDRMAAALAQLLDDKLARRRLGEAGRAHVGQHYTVAAWRERATELFGWGSSGMAPLSVALPATPPGSGR